MIVLQSSAPAIVPQGQVTIAQCFSTGIQRHQNLSPEGTAEILSGLANFRLLASPADPPWAFAGEISVYQRPLAVKKDIFAKRTQIENAKPCKSIGCKNPFGFVFETNPISRKSAVQAFSIQGRPRLFKVIQGYPNLFKGFWRKKDCLFFRSPSPGQRRKGGSRCR